MDDQNAVRVLRAYLGFFYDDKIDEKEVFSYQTQVKQLEDSYYFSTKLKKLKSFAVFNLLNFGKINYRMILAYDLVTILLDKGSDEEGFPESFYNFSEKLLFVYYPLGLTENKKTQELIGHLTQHRRMKNKITIVLTEVRLNDVEPLFDRHYSDLGAESASVGEL